MACSAARSAAGIGDEDISSFSKQASCECTKNIQLPFFRLQSLQEFGGCIGYTAKELCSLAFALYFPAARAIMGRNRFIQRQVDQH